MDTATVDASHSGGPSLKGIDPADSLRASVLMIGFGRFGQVTSQSLLADGMDVSPIDNNADRIRNAERFGFKVYYGDGTRLVVLRASGAEKARAVLVCIDAPKAPTHISELVRSAFPKTVLMVRAYVREHARELVFAGVDVQVLESFESTMLFGRRALALLGVNVLAAQTVSNDIRRRDAERFALEVSSNDDLAGVDKMFRGLEETRVEPVPFVEPERHAQ